MTALPSPALNTSPGCLYTHCLSPARFATPTNTAQNLTPFQHSPYPLEKDAKVANSCLELIRQIDILLFTSP